MEHKDINFQETLDFSKKLVERYRKSKGLHHKCYLGSQTAVIILSGITPLLLLFNVQPAIASIPPAAASIAAGLSNTFRYREKYVSSKVTFEEMSFEQKKFELGIEPYTRKGETEGSKGAVEIFIKNLESLHKKRMEEWREIQQESPEPRSNLENTSR